MFVLNTLWQIVPMILGTLWIVAIASKDDAPCGSASTRPAETIRDHLLAMANHARSLAVLIAQRSGASGGDGSS